MMCLPVKLTNIGLDVYSAVKFAKCRQSNKLIAGVCVQLITTTTSYLQHTSTSLWQSRCSGGDLVRRALETQRILSNQEIFGLTAASDNCRVSYRDLVLKKCTKN